MAPTQSNRLGPDAGILRPLRQLGSRRCRLRAARKFVGVELDTVMTRGLDGRLQGLMQRVVRCGRGSKHFLGKAFQPLPL